MTSTSYKTDTRLGAIERGLSTHEDFAIEWWINGGFWFEVHNICAFAADGAPLFAPEDEPVESESRTPPAGGGEWEGFLKWNGCLHLYCSGYMHFCGPERDPKIGRIVKALYALGPKHVPNWGDFNDPEGDPIQLPPKHSES